MTYLVDENEIPPPDATGSSGKQERAAGRVLPDEPQHGLPVVEAIEKGLAASPRGLGEFGSIMLAGAARQLANENQELKVEIARLRQSLDRQRDELENQRIQNAILTEKVKSERGNKHARNFGITVGTALVSAGLYRNLNDIDGYTLALIVGGVLLLLVSWFSPIKLRKNAPTMENKN